MEHGTDVVRKIRVVFFDSLMLISGLKETPEELVKYFLSTLFNEFSFYFSYIYFHICSLTEMCIGTLPFQSLPKSYIFQAGCYIIINYQLNRRLSVRFINKHCLDIV